MESAFVRTRLREKRAEPFLFTCVCHAFPTLSHTVNDTHDLIMKHRVSHSRSERRKSVSLLYPSLFLGVPISPPFCLPFCPRSSIRGAPAQLLPGQRSENNSKRASTDAESANEVDTVEDEVDEQVGEMVSAREEAERCDDHTQNGCG